MKKKFIILIFLLFAIFSICGCTLKEKFVLEEKTAEESEDQSNENEEIKMFEGEYSEGFMGFENESYSMTFKNDSEEIAVIANEEPEISYFIDGEDGLPVENQDLKGMIFKVYYKEKNVLDENTKENTIVLEYIASEVSE